MINIAIVFFNTLSFQLFLFCAFPIISYQFRCELLKMLNSDKIPISVERTIYMYKQVVYSPFIAISRCYKLGLFVNINPTKTPVYTKTRKEPQRYGRADDGMLIIYPLLICIYTDVNAHIIPYEILFENIPILPILSGTFACKS